MRDFEQFIQTLDDTLKHLYKPKMEFLVCGDINTDHLIEREWKKQLASLATTYNLSHKVPVLPLIIYLWIRLE